MKEKIEPGQIKKSRGGAREGAGRKPSGLTSGTVSIYLPDIRWKRELKKEVDKWILAKKKSSKKK